MTHWWEGKAHDPSTHERINAAHWPGTRQICTDCGEPTGRCEEDTMHGFLGPVCEACYDMGKDEGDDADNAHSQSPFGPINDF